MLSHGSYLTLQLILLTISTYCNALAMISKIPNKLQHINSLQNKFFALRHGQSLANIAKIISSDPSISTVEHGLSDVGKEQVSISAKAFAQNYLEKQCHDKYSGVAIFSSDFTRARETAGIFAKTVMDANIPLYQGTVNNEVRLRERFFGDFNGGSDEHYQDVWDIDCNDPNHTDFNVESVNSVVGRTSGLILDLEEELKATGGDPYKVILVAHGDVLQILQTAFLKRPGSEHRSLEHLETASVREIHLAN